MKIDISKAFDTLSWTFLLKVLKAYGLSDKLCQWTNIILNSATMFISINNIQREYFGCRRGDQIEIPHISLGILCGRRCH